MFLKIIFFLKMTNSILFPPVKEKKDEQLINNANAIIGISITGNY